MNTKEMKNSKFMNRQVILRVVVFTVAACFLTFFASGQANSQGSVSSQSGTATKSAGEKTEAKEEYKPKTKAQLKRSLTAMQYYVTQQEGTEKAFKNRYWANKKDGTYHCICCDKPLFKSDTKYKSGTGWPSFTIQSQKSAIGTRNDWKLIYTRVEVHCKRCNAHLGHVFDDGPKPTGKRYCMNSASLKFVEKREESEPKTPVTK